MTYKTHSNFAVLISNIIILNFYGTLEETLLFLFIASIAAIIPDIDHIKSHVNRTIIPIIIIILGLFHEQYSLLLIWIVLAYLVPHRKFTHSIIGTIVFMIPFYNNYFMPILIGYTSHILGDMLFGGTFFFWPFKQRITIMNLKTASKIETVIHTILLLINGYLLLIKDYLYI